MVQLLLSPEQQILLENCLTEFKALLFQESEYKKLFALQAKVFKRSELTADDIVFIKGVCEVLNETYVKHLNACDANPLKYPPDIRKHYANKILSITDLKSLF